MNLQTLNRLARVATSLILPILALPAPGAVAAMEDRLDGGLEIPLPPVAKGGKAAFVENQWLMGRVLDNVANKDRQGSGFNPLCSRAYPGKSIYSTKDTGLNFEHIFNGLAADKTISMFTPRKDIVELTQISKTSVRLRWPAEHSAWGVECEMIYTLADRDAIDLEFSVTPTQPRFAQGYLVLMWASYLASARDRKIYFYGEEAGREGWIAFGEDRNASFETGTVSYRGVPALPYEKDSQTLNIVEHPAKHFLKPFYFGLLDGDQDHSTTNDTLAYVMMFDQNAPIRFALWNFVRDASGKADPRRPAWDWQFVIRQPILGRPYRYRARVVICPFTSRDDVLKLYEQWSKTLTEPQPPGH